MKINLKTYIMKEIILLLLLVISCQLSYSQVPKKVIVEHFTNTKCSICASRNPGFYINLKKHTEVIHLAIHPSSPYSACVLSMHNPVENDARTNYYGVYGGTPRLVIQGVVIASGVNYSSASIFTPYLGQTSPASIKIIQSKYGTDSIRSRIIIKTEATNSLGALNLFVALAEDTINYTGSNGEPSHYDVFRKSLTGANGISVTLPTNVGDSIVYTMSSVANPTWNFSRIFTLAILQEDTSKAVVQSQSVTASSNDISSGISNPYPSNSNITTFAIENGIMVNQDIFYSTTSIIVYDIVGKIMLNKFLTTSSEKVILSNNKTGVYLYVIKSNNSIIKTGKLFIH